jgi:hypothetical protein
MSIAGAAKVRAYLAVTEREIDRYVADGILIEVTSDEQKQQ